MQTLHIATACFVRDHNALLVVRKKGTQAWMLPGGKLDPGETAEAALIRELNEELQISVAADQLTVLGQFEAAAANEADTRVHARAFTVDVRHAQNLQMAAEIEAVQWLRIDGRIPPEVAPLLRAHIIPALLARGRCAQDAMQAL